MIQTNDNQDPRILEDEFYAKEFSFSYSSLNKLLYSPSLFYRDYVLGQKEEEMDKSLVEGRLIHALLLDQDSFDELFVISQSKLPSDNVKDVINRIYEMRLSEERIDDQTYPRNSLSEYSTEILEILKEKNFYQTIKKDEDRLAKIISEENEDYFDFLKRSTGKTIIDPATYSRCTDVVDMFKRHECMKIMGMDKDSDPTCVYNEMFVETSPGLVSPKEFGLKGSIDNIFIDKKEKKIRVNDIKTTSKTITDFPETVKFYNYWMQAAIYMRLVRMLTSNMLDDTDDYDMVFSFVVIDKYNQIYVFEVSEETMTNWEIDLQEKLKEALYHYDKRDYSLPYKFVTSKVRL